MASDQSSSSSSDILRNARFAPSSSQDEIVAPTASAMLTDAAALHPLAGLNSSDLDYLSLDDGKLNDLEGGQTVLPSRGWSDELCYGTGTTYLFGLGAGGLWGLREGWARSRKIPTGSNATLNNAVKQAGAAAASSTSEALKTTPPPAAAASPAASAAATATSSAKPSTPAQQAASTARQAFKSPSFRVRLNTVLNSVTRRGSFVGNNAGVLAMIYNGFNSGIDKYRGRHDIYGSMLAGASTGLIWKSTAGVRPMFIASAGMTVGAAAWTVIKPKLL